MKRDQILRKVQELVVGQLACDVEIVQENESFENLGADSLDVVELVLAAEVEFGIEISALQDFKTVKDLVDFVEKKLN